MPITTSPRPWVLVVLGVLTFIGLALPASGADEPLEWTLGGSVKPGHALRITIDGELHFSLVARNSKYFAAALGNATTGAPGASLGSPGLPGSGSGGDFWTDPRLTLNFDFQLADTVEGRVGLETPFNVLGDAGGANTSITSGSNRYVEVEEAFVDWNYNEACRLRVGIQDYAKDFTGMGQPFFIDISHSESPFFNPGAADFGSPQAPSSGLVGTQEASGVLVSYEPQNWNLRLDAFYFVINETFRKNSDDNVFGMTLEQVIEDENSSSRLGLLAVGLQNDASSYLWTVGGGGSLSVMNGTVNVYGEAYAQMGQYIANAGGALGSRDIDQTGAFAITGGFRYYLAATGDRNRDPFFDFSYTELSGDDEGDDSKNENFVSLENNNDLIVVEDGYYGLDIDTNYRAAKLKVGFSLSEKWLVELTGAYIELQDNNGTADNTPASHDKIGDEVDVEFTYLATDYLTFKFASGWLFDPNALGMGDDINVTVVSAKIDF